MSFQGNLKEIHKLKTFLQPHSNEANGLAMDGVDNTMVSHRVTPTKSGPPPQASLSSAFTAINTAVAPTVSSHAPGLENLVPGGNVKLAGKARRTGHMHSSKIGVAAPTTTTTQKTVKEQETLVEETITRHVRQANSRRRNVIDDDNDEDIMPNGASGLKDATNGRNQDGGDKAGDKDRSDPVDKTHWGMQSAWPPVGTNLHMRHVAAYFGVSLDASRLFVDDDAVDIAVDASDKLKFDHKKANLPPGPRLKQIAEAITKGDKDDSYYKEYLKILETLAESIKCVTLLKNPKTGEDLRWLEKIMNTHYFFIAVKAMFGPPLKDGPAINPKPASIRQPVFPIPGNLKCDKEVIDLELFGKTKEQMTPRHKDRRAVPDAHYDTLPVPVAVAGPSTAPVVTNVNLLGSEAVFLKGAAGNRPCSSDFEQYFGVTHKRMIEVFTGKEMEAALQAINDLMQTHRKKTLPRKDSITNGFADAVFDGEKPDQPYFKGYLNLLQRLPRKWEGIDFWYNPRSKVQFERSERWIMYHRLLQAGHDWEGKGSGPELVIKAEKTSGRRMSLRKVAQDSDDDMADDSYGVPNKNMRGSANKKATNIPSSRKIPRARSRTETSVNNDGDETMDYMLGPSGGTRGVRGRSGAPVNRVLDYGETITRGQSRRSIYNESIGHFNSPNGFTIPNRSRSQARGETLGLSTERIERAGFFDHDINMTVHWSNAGDFMGAEAMRVIYSADIVDNTEPFTFGVFAHWVEEKFELVKYQQALNKPKEFTVFIEQPEGAGPELAVKNLKVFEEGWKYILARKKDNMHFQFFTVPAGPDWEE